MKTFMIWCFMGLVGVVIAQALEIRNIKLEMVKKSQLRDVVRETVDRDSQLYHLLDAKRDCEIIVPRTHECVLIYEYVEMEK